MQQDVSFESASERQDLSPQLILSTISALGQLTPPKGVFFLVSSMYLVVIQTN